MTSLHLRTVSIVGRLHDVTLTLSRGLTVVVGENGAGKSTLLDVAAGILPPSAGAVVLDDVDVRTLAPRERARHIASLGQASADLDITALERIAHGLAPRRGSGALVDDATRARVVTVASELGVDALLDRDVASLSSGQRRRVEVARALVDDGAACVLVDEPHAAVDVRHQSLVSRALIARARAGSIVVVSVHDLAVAASIADRVIGLRDGRVVVDGPPADAITSENVERIYGISGAVVVREHDSVGVLFPPR
jgi:iron complex transport system ATP-binding protein